MVDVEYGFGPLQHLKILRRRERPELELLDAGPSKGLGRELVVHIPQRVDVEVREDGEPVVSKTVLLSSESPTERQSSVKNSGSSLKSRWFRASMGSKVKRRSKYGAWSTVCGYRPMASHR